jgi:hypothetical protein
MSVCRLIMGAGASSQEKLTLFIIQLATPVGLGDEAVR